MLRINSKHVSVAGIYVDRLALVDPDEYERIPLSAEQKASFHLRVAAPKEEVQLTEENLEIAIKEKITKMYVQRRLRCGTSVDISKLIIDCNAH